MRAQVNSTNERAAVHKWRITRELDADIHSRESFQPSNRTRGRGEMPFSKIPHSGKIGKFSCFLQVEERQQHKKRPYYTHQINFSSGLKSGRRLIATRQKNLVASWLKTVISSETVYPGDIRSFSLEELRAGRHNLKIIRGVFGSNAEVKIPGLFERYLVSIP